MVWGLMIVIRRIIILGGEVLIGWVERLISSMGWGCIYEALRWHGVMSHDYVIGGASGRLQGLRLGRYMITITMA